MRTTGTIRDERAEAGAVGTILMIALVVTLASGLYLWTSAGTTTQAPPHAMGLAGSNAEGASTFTLAAVSTGAPWNDVRITLDGVASGYAITVDGGDWSQASTNAPWDGSGLAQPRYAQPGDAIRVTVTTTPSGPVTMRVVDQNANAVIATMPVLGLHG